ncbi:MAG: ABC transporter permease [Candidatus Levybacteria bacterium]|nr:ABC transporter permease [Candidatus Levybacteria bacterium]
MNKRYFYTLIRSYDRLSDMFYWPVMDILVWGITGLYFASLSQNPKETTTVLLTGLIFWVITWRSQYEITVNLLTELWDRNLVNIFSSPLKLSEWITSVIIYGGTKMSISLVFSAATAFILYKYAFFQFGAWLVPIFINLGITGWVIGFIVASIIIRYGLKAQTLAWTGAYIIVPFSAIYYPLSILPDWAQKISLLIPSSYVFEAMRQHIFLNTISADKIFVSFALNIFYLILSILLFTFAFKKSKQKGLGRLIG